MDIAVLADPDTIDCARERIGHNEILYFSDMDAAIRTISKHRIKLFFVTASSVDMEYLNRQLSKLPFWVRMFLISRDKGYMFMSKSRNEGIIDSGIM